MLWRPVRDIDLDVCLNIEPRHIGAELVRLQKALAAWRWMLNSPSFEGAVFEANTPGSRRRIVGFGSSTFVSASFADDEVENPRPGLNARIVASIVNQHPVLLDYEQLRHANTHGQLQVVVLTSVWEPSLSDAEFSEGHVLMPSVFMRHYIGYQISRILYEAIGEVEVKIHSATMVSRFVSKYGDDRALACITRESAFSVTGSSVSPLFVDRRPVLCLTEADQRLLHAAIDGLTDEELARHLNLHIGAVKKRWARIFTHLSTTLPEISESRDGSECATRGKQKRHHVLAFVREHPEELRPFDYSDGTPQGPLRRRAISEDAIS